MRRSTKIIIGIAAAAVLATVAGVAVEAIRLRRAPGVQELSPHVSGYAALAQGATKATRKEVTLAAQQGRMIAPVAVAGADAHLDYGVYDAMPESERPLRDSAVTAIALLRYWEEEEDGFVDEFCQVTIIDRATGHILTVETIAEFAGPVRVGSNEERGELQPSEIAEYLLSPSSWTKAGFDLEPPPD